MGVSKKELKYSFGYDLMKLIGSVVIYYAILFSGELYPICSELQIISLIPLLYIVYYSYKICNSETMKRLYYNRVLGWCMKFIGGLCLEIYLVQSELFTDKMNSIFPLNIIIMFVIIILVAYILRCVARFFSQTFKDGDYDWKAIIKLI